MVASRGQHGAGSGQRAGKWGKKLGFGSHSVNAEFLSCNRRATRRWVCRRKRSGSDDGAVSASCGTGRGIHVVAGVNMENNESEAMTKKLCWKILVNELH